MHADWIDLFALFAKHKVRYLIIGGNAVNFHGHERYTKDIDIWVSPAPENAKAVYLATREFGAVSSAVKPEHFEDPDAFVVIGAEPYRIDILMGPPGADFDKAYKRRVKDKRGPITLNYVALEDLLALKGAANRPVDQRDVEMLEIGKQLSAKTGRTPAQKAPPSPNTRASRARPKPATKKRAVRRKATKKKR